MLRPFYFIVHPDLFGRHPLQRVTHWNPGEAFQTLTYVSFQSTNEESLKHLSAHLEALQSRRMSSVSPKNLSFYIRDSEQRDKFKLITIRLDRHSDVKLFIKNVLEACSLPTAKLDKIKVTQQSSTQRSQSNGRGDTFYGNAAEIFEEYEIYLRNMQKTKQEKTLR